MTVTNDAFSELQQQLGDIPPETLTRLSPEQLRDLAGAIQAARHRQAAELAAAGNQAFNLLPRLLRGPIRKLLR